MNVIFLNVPKVAGHKPCFRRKHPAVMNFETWLKGLHPQIPEKSAQAVVMLHAEGGTVPFIARYRKEATGNLDEMAIQSILDAQEAWGEMVKRKAFILKEIADQQKLTPELKKKIDSTFDLAQLEDLYLPYKQKKKTKAQKARDAGLEPLALWIWQLAHGEIQSSTFLDEEAGKYLEKVKTLDEAKEGARDILVERLQETQHLRQLVREKIFKEGLLRAAKGSDAKEPSKFSDYFTYEETIVSLLKPEHSHRYLAIRRGWNEKELKVTVGGDETLESRLLSAFQKEAWVVANFPGKDLLETACDLALKGHVMPSIENEVHKALKDLADEAAIKVFAENVRKLLLAAPFGAKAVLGIDPGIRTGCKIAVVDDAGKYLASTVIQLQSERDRAHATLLLTEVIKNSNIRAIAVGNGTYGRETEAFVRGVMTEKKMNVPVVLVSESGASIYSASEVAREEFPDLDLTVRGAISIARRLQDPLAELVKVDPKSIGVGQYQHDVSQPMLKKSLEYVVDSCVNSVGVNLNTASEYLLAHVSGIGPAVAKNIVKQRTTKGLFKSRMQLLEVGRFSQKIFEQAAGFLRIPQAENPFDNTGIHPERYEVLEQYAKQIGKTPADLIGANAAILREAEDLKLQIGAFTFDDIIRELEKPGRDPREEFVAFHFREDIHDIADLKVDMRCPGIVTNVTNFGAFVDIGVHQDGLVHISALADHFIKDPREVVSPGDRVQVRVIEVDATRKRIALSMRSENSEKVAAPRTAKSTVKSASPRPPQKSVGVKPGGAKPYAAKPQGNKPPPFKPRAEKPRTVSAPPPRQGIDPNSPFAALMNRKFPGK